MVKKKEKEMELFIGSKRSPAFVGRSDPIRIRHRLGIIFIKQLLPQSKAQTRRGHRMQVPVI